MSGADPTLLAVLAAIAASAGALARATLVARIHVLGIPLLLAGWVGLGWSVLPASVTDRAVLAALALAVSVAAGWLVAGRLVGRERWLLAAGAALLALRVPVPTGADDRAMLLAPLYVVLALGALVAIRGELAALRTGEVRLADRGGATRLVDVGTALLPALATASLTWSWVPADTTESLAFYLVPFVLAYALVRTWLPAGVDLRPASVALVASTLVYAAVGLVQAATREVWWNPKVIDANRFRPDVRTNSLLWDPNIYGRVLVVGLLALVAWLLVRRLAPRAAAIVVVALAVLGAALWNTYSQSSWIALAAATALLAVLTLPPRPRRWVAALLVVVVLAGLPVAARQLAGDDADGRREVVQTGLALASERPLAGWGVGTFEAAARARERERGEARPRLVASHTTPVTIFAELGILGAFAYLTLLTSAAVAVLARWRRASTAGSVARTSGADAFATGWPDAPLVWATGVLAALFAHSLLYASFFEDPITWVALAVLASLPVAGSAREDTEGVTAHTG